MHAVTAEENCHWEAFSTHAIPPKGMRPALLCLKPLPSTNISKLTRCATERARNVQKQSRGSSSCFAVIVAEHSAESLTPLDSGVRFANGAERPRQAVF